jgi:hypothetical protein
LQKKLSMIPSTRLFLKEVSTYGLIGSVVKSW